MAVGVTQYSDSVCGLKTTVTALMPSIFDEHCFERQLCPQHSDLCRESRFATQPPLTSPLNYSLESGNKLGKHLMASNRLLLGL